MSSENIKRTMMWAYIATGAAQVFELLFNYVLYLFIPIAEIGVYSWAAALVVFFNVVVSMGIDPILLRKFGQKEFPLFTAFRVILLLRMPIIVLGVLLLYYIYASGRLSLTQYEVLMLVGAHAIFNVFDGVFGSWLRANSRQTVTNFIACFQSGLKCTAITVLYFLALNSLFYVLLLLLLVRTIGSILFFVYAHNMQASQQEHLDGNFYFLPIAGDLLRTGMSVGGIALLSAVQNRLDWLLISEFISITALASYAIANKFYEITQVIIGVSLTTLYPWLCQRDESNESRLLLLLRIIIFIGVLISVGGILFGPRLIDLMFGNKYSNVGLSVQLMMLSAGLIAVSGTFYQIALAKGFEKLLLAVAVVATTLQLASNLYWIPKLGITGAAIGMLVLQIATAGGLLCVVLYNRLLATDVVKRIMIFLVLFMMFALLIILFKITAWYVLSSIGLIILGAGWLILFRKDERIQLVLYFNTLTHANK